MKNNKAIWIVSVIALIAMAALLFFNDKPLFGSAIQAQAEETPVIVAIMLMFMAFFFIGLILLLIIYVYTALALYAIAKRMKTPNAWLAWIPIANIYLMTQIGKLPGWTMLFIVCVFVPYLGPAVVTVFSIVLWWKIAEARKYPGWWGLLMIIPLVNFVLIGILAWAKK